MKVKIIKCSDNEFWYHDKIGKIFEVEVHKSIYQYNRSDGWRCFINIEDAVDVRELKLERILDEKE